MCKQICRQAAFGVACFLFLSAVGCSKVSPKRAATASQASQGDAISIFTLEGHDEAGRRTWQVRGQSADILSETVHLSPVAATSYGQVQVDLKADNGDYEKKNQNIYLKKHVVVTSSDGMKLTTKSLRWFAERETGTTPDWVTVTRAGVRVTGRGAKGFPKRKFVRLEKRVRLILNGDKGRTVVTCDGPMEVDYGRHKARFWRSVIVRDAKGTIRSDRMDVTLTPQTDQIEKAAFWGHVKIVHGPQAAFANRANYWQPQGRTSLIGHPKLVMVPEKESLGE